MTFGARRTRGQRFLAAIIQHALNRSGEIAQGRRARPRGTAPAVAGADATGSVQSWPDNRKSVSTLQESSSAHRSRGLPHGLAGRTPARWSRRFPTGFRAAESPPLPRPPWPLAATASLPRSLTAFRCPERTRVASHCRHRSTTDSHACPTRQQVPESVLDVQPHRWVKTHKNGPDAKGIVPDLRGVKGDNF